MLHEDMLPLPLWHCKQRVWDECMRGHAASSTCQCGWLCPLVSSRVCCGACSFKITSLQGTMQIKIHTVVMSISFQDKIEQVGRCQAADLTTWLLAVWAGGVFRHQPWYEQNVLVSDRSFEQLSCSVSYLCIGDATVLFAAGWKRASLVRVYYHELKLLYSCCG